MRKPKTPPKTEDIMEQFAHDPIRLLKLSREHPSPLAYGKYLHWDKLVHYDPPAGMTHEAWWRCLKNRREEIYKPTGLYDFAQSPFCYADVEPIPERLHQIDLSAGGGIQMPEQVTNPETRDQYYVTSLIEEAITSSQLEGAATTRQVAKEMIRTGRKPADRSEQMILNNYRTMRRIGELKSDSLTPELVFEIHRLITYGTLDDPSAAGSFREDADHVFVGDDRGEVFYVPPPADQLAERLDAMCRFANGEAPAGFIHPAIRSIVLHFWLACDHPFVDGNGRTARALFYWSMLHYGYWLVEFLSISHIIRKAPAQYSRAFLYTETDDNDLTYFILYHLEVIRRAIDELHAYIRRKTAQLRRLEGELQGVAMLNHRQRALISHALRHPHQYYTVETHRMSHNVVPQTARTDLLDLRERGLLDGRKIGRTWHFSPVADLERRLARLS